jgi:hypothetical protein
MRQLTYNFPISSTNSINHLQSPWITLLLRLQLSIQAYLGFEEDFSQGQTIPQITVIAVQNRLEAA